METSRIPSGSEATSNKEKGREVRGSGAHIGSTFASLPRRCPLYLRFGVPLLREAGWGVYAYRSDDTATSLWGPFVTDSAATNIWVGASRSTNHTGEISAMYHALKWLPGDIKALALATSRQRVLRSSLRGQLDQGPLQQTHHSTRSPTPPRRAPPSLIGYLLD